MTGRTRTLLIALAALVLAAIAIWKLRGGDAPQSAGPAPGAAEDKPDGVPGPAPRRPVDPRSGPVAAGRPGPDDVDLDDGDGDPTTRTYVMDNGAVVRDHRGAGAAPPINPPPMRPDQRTMSTVITARIYQQLAPAVASCGAAVPAADRGADPFTYVTMTVKVAKGALTTIDVYPTINDIGGASAASFTTCVTDKAMAISLTARDEPDHDDYIVQYPIRLRALP